MLIGVLETLRRCRWVDLTHSFDETIPHASGLPPARCETLAAHDPSGYLVQRWTLVGQWGTHVDPPAHFVAGLRHQDEIPVTEMILPLVVLDICDAVANDHDRTPTLTDLASYERRNGRPPEGAFVALHTGWGQRWPDADALRNADRDGRRRSPGWSRGAIDYVFDTWHATAIGHDTLDADPGLLTDNGVPPLELAVLARDAWQLEAMANLDQVPESGALIVATWPKARAGAGFPARAFAIVPA